MVKHHIFTCLIGLLIFLSACSRKTGSPNAGYTVESDVRNSLVAEAERHIGDNYRYGGSKPGCFDCSGLTSYIYHKHDISLHRISNDQAKQGEKVDLSDAEAGDLLFFGKGKIDHVGILVKNRKNIIMVHSTSSEGVVKMDLVQSRYWNNRFRFARRVL